jgi:hypothetical protein
MSRPSSTLGRVRVSCERYFARLEERGGVVLRLVKGDAAHTFDCGIAITLTYLKRIL